MTRPARAFGPVMLSLVMLGAQPALASDPASARGGSSASDASRVRDRGGRREAGRHATPSSGRFGPSWLRLRRPGRLRRPSTLRRALLRRAVPTLLAAGAIVALTPALANAPGAASSERPVVHGQTAPRVAVQQHTGTAPTEQQGPTGPTGPGPSTQQPTLTTPEAPAPFDAKSVAGLKSGVRDTEVLLGKTFDAANSQIPEDVTAALDGTTATSQNLRTLSKTLLRSSAKLSPADQARVEQGAADLAAVADTLDGQRTDLTALSKAIGEQDGVASLTVTGQITGTNGPVRTAFIRLQHAKSILGITGKAAWQPPQVQTPVAPETAPTTDPSSPSAPTPGTDPSAGSTSTPTPSGTPTEPTATATP